MKILIIGATGFIGRALVPFLVSESFEVICVSRNVDVARNILGNHVHILPWDSRASEGLVPALSGVDAIVNLAGESLAKGRWTEKRKKELIASRVVTGKLLAEAILSMPAKPKVVLQASATGFYGPQTAGPVDESAGQGAGFLAELNRQWEASVTPVKAAGVRVVILRTGVVLEKDGGMLEQLLIPFRFYAGTTLGSGRQFIPWIHLTDEIRAIVHLLRNASSEGPYNLTAPNPVTMAALTRGISIATGKPAWMKVPGFVLKAIFGKMADEALLASQQVLPARLLSEGFRFSYPELAPALSNLLSKRAG
jgi:uncharacterized protein